MYVVQNKSKFAEAITHTCVDDCLGTLGQAEKLHCMSQYIVRR